MVKEQRVSELLKSDEHTNKMINYILETLLNFKDREVFISELHCSMSIKDITKGIKLSVPNSLSLIKGLCTFVENLPADSEVIGKEIEHIFRIKLVNIQELLDIIEGQENKIAELEESVAKQDERFDKLINVLESSNNPEQKEVAKIEPVIEPPKKEKKKQEEF